jgi:hypothetical protein
MCVHSSLTFGKRRKSKSERRKDQPFIPLETSSLIPYWSGTTSNRRSSTTQPLLLVLFPLSLFHLVPGPWVPPTKKEIPLCLCALCWFETHVLYQPTVVGKPPPLLFCLSHPLCYWEGKRKYEESVVLRFFCLSLTDSRTLTTVIDRYNANFGYRFLKIIPLFDSTYRILFDNIISSLNWIRKWQAKTSSDNY